LDSPKVRLNRHEYYLAMLKLVAARSTCIRREVGAIITDKESHVLSTGYNGVPRFFDHCIDLPCAGANEKSGDTSNCMAVHAEQNALLQCTSLDRAYTIYCSCVPCFVCAKMIANTGIEVVICETTYADTRGLQVLIEKGCYIEIAGKVVDGENNS
jgi:dCMP deaminase